MLFTSVLFAAVLVISHVIGMTAAAISCPESYVPIAQSCFQFVSEFHEWAGAEANCESLGGHLAVLDDCSLFGDVVKRINAQVMTAYAFWIGATDIMEEGSWLWVTGESVEMGTPFWGQSDDSFEPNGGTASNCLEINRDNRHYFHDADCFILRESICQTNPTGTEDEWVLHTSGTRTNVNNLTRS